MNETKPMSTLFLRPAFVIAVQPGGQVGVTVRAEGPRRPAPAPTPTQLN